MLIRKSDFKIPAAADELIDDGNQWFSEKGISGVDGDVYFVHGVISLIYQHNAMLWSILRAYAVIVAMQIPLLLMPSMMILLAHLLLSVMRNALQ